MPSRLDKAAELVGDAIGTVETASKVAGKRTQQGLREAKAVIEASESANRIEKRARPIAKKTAKKVESIKRTAKRKAAISKSAGKKQVANVRRSAKERSATAKKRTTAATRKATGAKKAAKKRTTAATRRPPGPRRPPRSGPPLPRGRPPGPRRPPRSGPPLPRARPPGPRRPPRSGPRGVFAELQCSGKYPWRAGSISTISKHESQRGEPLSRLVRMVVVRKACVSTIKELGEPNHVRCQCFGPSGRHAPATPPSVGAGTVASTTTGHRPPVDVERRAACVDLPNHEKYLN